MELRDQSPSTVGGMYIGVIRRRPSLVLTSICLSNGPWIRGNILIYPVLMRGDKISIKTGRKKTPFIGTEKRHNVKREKCIEKEERKNSGRIFQQKGRKESLSLRKSNKKRK